MKPSGLDRLFKPQSIAVIGASTDPQKAGHVVIRHLLAGQFKGPILPVSPHSKAVAGVLAYADIDSLPLAPDLAIVCTRRERVLTSSKRLASVERAPPSYWRQTSLCRSGSNCSSSAGNTASACSAPTAWGCCCRARASMPVSRRLPPSPVRLPFSPSRCRQHHHPGLGQAT